MIRELFQPSPRIYKLSSYKTFKYSSYIYIVSSQVAYFIYNFIYISSFSKSAIFRHLLIA
jgi:hypothetical protein